MFRQRSPTSMTRRRSNSLIPCKTNGWLVHTKNLRYIVCQTLLFFILMKVEISSMICLIQSNIQERNEILSSGYDNGGHWKVERRCQFQTLWSSFNKTNPQVRHSVIFQGFQNALYFLIIKTNCSWYKNSSTLNRMLKSGQENYVPESWDWRNVDGVNYVPKVTNHFFISLFSWTLWLDMLHL